MNLKRQNYSFDALSYVRRKNPIDLVTVKDGKITVRVEKAENSKVIFTVEDNGIGIKPEKADKGEQY